MGGTKMSHINNTDNRAFNVTTPSVDDIARLNLSRPEVVMDIIFGVV